MLFQTCVVPPALIACSTLHTAFRELPELLQFPRVEEFEKPEIQARIGVGDVKLWCSVSRYMLVRDRRMNDFTFLSSKGLVAGSIG